MRQPYINYLGKDSSNANRIESLQVNHLVKFHSQVQSELLLKALVAPKGPPIDPEWREILTIKLAQTQLCFCPLLA